MTSIRFRCPASARSLPSSLYAITETVLTRLSVVRRNRPETASRTFTHESFPAVTSSLPSGRKATAETPFFQVGESKYGKPILDRVIGGGLTLDEVAKCALISMDSTMKSNLSVGLPLDLLCYERDSLRVTRRTLIDARDEYFSSIRGLWGEQLKKVFNELPEPHYWK